MIRSDLVWFLGGIWGPAERGHGHQGIIFPLKCLRGPQQSFGTCQSKTHLDGRTWGFPAEHCPKHHLQQWPLTQQITWYQRNGDRAQQQTEVRFCWFCAISNKHRSVWARFCSLICNKRTHCCSDTFLSEPAVSSSPDWRCSHPVVQPPELGKPFYFPCFAYFLHITVAMLRRSTVFFD